MNAALVVGPGTDRARRVGAEPLPGPSWRRRLGAAGFLFFMVKGLAWLALPLLAAVLR